MPGIQSAGPQGAAIIVVALASLFFLTRRKKRIGKPSVAEQVRQQVLAALNRIKDDKRWDPARYISFQD
jgi:hypothetical protein